jgi:hypothetical protein
MVAKPEFVELVHALTARLLERHELSYREVDAILTRTMRALPSRRIHLRTRTRLKLWIRSLPRRVRAFVNRQRDRRELRLRARRRKRRARGRRVRPPPSEPTHTPFPYDERRHP